MTVLALETSGPQAGVCLLRDGEVIAERVRPCRHAHVEVLPGEIDAALAEAGISVGDLSGLAVSAGPGHFTGLRVGLATAKGIALATGAPLVLVSSLAALAASRSAAGRLVVAAVDARRSEVFWAPFRAGGTPERLADDALAAPAAVASRARDLADGLPWTVVGSGASRVAAALADGDGGIEVVDVPAPAPSAIAALGALRLARGEADDLDRAEPSYVRASDAETARPDLVRRSR